MPRRKWESLQAHKLLCLPLSIHQAPRDLPFWGKPSRGMTWIWWALVPLPPLENMAFPNGPLVSSTPHKSLLSPFQVNDRGLTLKCSHWQHIPEDRPAAQMPWSMSSPTPSSIQIAGFTPFSFVRLRHPLLPQKCHLHARKLVVPRGGWP